MAVTPILSIPLVAPTQTDKTTTMNDAIAAVEKATQDQLPVSMAGGNVTLTTLQFTRNVSFLCSGLTADRDLIVPLVKRVFIVRNASAYNVTAKGATGSTVVIAGGDGAIIQCDGTDCVSLAAGGPGVAGPTGLAGGAITIGYAFSTTTTNADPGNGNLRLNAGTQNTATAIYADLLDGNGIDWTTVLDSLDDSTSTEKGQIRLLSRTDDSKWILFTISAVVSHTGYRELTVAVVASSTTNPFNNADAVLVAFTRTGNAGATGSTGIPGTAGASTAWHDGTGVPSGGLGANGDYYLDDATGDVYLKNTGNSPAWGIVANIAGPAGTGSSIPNDEFLANVTGSSAVPTGTTLSAFLDAVLGTTAGKVVYRSGSGWVAGTARTAGRMQAQWASGATVANDTIYFAYDVPYDGTINSLTHLCATGSFTVAVQINGTPVTGLGAVSPTSTPTTTNATAANTFTAGQRISGVITGTTGSPTDAVLSLNVTWAN